METSIHTVEKPAAIILAGLFGSVLSLSFVDGMSWRQRAAAVVAGMVMAHYISPLIANLFHEENYEETIGFLVGLFGMSIVAAFFRAIKRADIWGFVEGRWGGQSSDGGTP